MQIFNVIISGLFYIRQFFTPQNRKNRNKMLFMVARHLLLTAALCQLIFADL